MRHRKKFKFRRLKVIQVIFYIVVRYLITILSFFQLKAALGIGRFLGMLVYILDGKHRRIAYDNFVRAMQMEYSPQGVKQVIRGVYEHIGMSVVELLFLPRLMRKEAIQRYFKLKNFDIMDKLLKGGKGVIVVIAHLGNWEVAGLAANMTGYYLNSVARPIENPYIDEYLNRYRSSTGQRIIPKYDAVYSMGEVLRDNGMLVVLADQDAKKRGIFVDFFGRKASTTRSPAILALKYNTPIVPVNIYRDSKGLSHTAVVTEPIYPENANRQDVEIERLTALYTLRLEQFIREHPKQWMWMHKRWKTEYKKDGVKNEAAVV